MDHTWSIVVVSFHGLTLGESISNAGLALVSGKKVPHASTFKAVVLAIKKKEAGDEKKVGLTDIWLILKFTKFQHGSFNVHLAGW